MTNKYIQNQNSQQQASTRQVIFNVDSINSITAFAAMMADGKSAIPDHFRGNVADCAAVVMLAAQWNMSPFMVAQKTFTIGGKIGYEAQLVNAVVCGSGLIEGDEFDYEYIGDWDRILGKNTTKKNSSGKEYLVVSWQKEDESGLGVIISAKMRKTGKIKKLKILMSQAATRNSTLWASNPKQQLAYLAVKNWARLHTPGVLLGVYTRDELQEIKEQEERDITPEKEDVKKVLEIPEEKIIDEKPVHSETEDDRVNSIIDALNVAETREHIEAIQQDIKEVGSEENLEKIRKVYGESIQRIKKKYEAMKEAEALQEEIKTAIVEEEQASAVIDDSDLAQSVEQFEKELNGE